MKEKLLAFILKKMNWGKLLPTLFRAIAEGQAGEVPKKIYWLLSGKKTFIGALLIGVGTASEEVCANYTQFPWTCEASTWIFYLGALMASVGLVDGGTRAPWPEGTPKEGVK